MFGSSAKRAPDRAALCFALCAACSPPVDCEAVASEGITIDVRECGETVRAYVENSGAGAVAFSMAGQEIHLDPEYGTTITVWPTSPHVTLRAEDIHRSPSDVVWTDVDVAWDEPVPHGSGVEVRSRRCGISEGGSLRCELGVRNFGAKPVDVSLRVVAGRSFVSEREHVFPGDAIVMIASGRGARGDIRVHGVVRTPPKR